MADRKYLQEKIGKITDTEVHSLFLNEFAVDMSDYNEAQIQYSDFENENYKITGEIDQHGGEGEGSEYWLVSRIFNKKTEEVYFIQFSGYYDSWNGTDWSENYWTVVEPKEKTIVVWA